MSEYLSAWGHGPYFRCLLPGDAGTTSETVVSATRKKYLPDQRDGNVDLWLIFSQPTTEKCCFHRSNYPPSTLGVDRRRQRAEKMVTYLEGNLNLGKCRIFQPSETPRFNLKSAV